MCHCVHEEVAKQIPNVRFTVDKTKIYGNNNEFVDKLLDGEEVIYTYNGKKYFSQGYTQENSEYYFELVMWKPKTEVLWSIEGHTHQESFDAFLKEPLFDGKTFWECEKEMEWVDY